MCKKFTFCRLRRIVHLQTQFIGNHGDELAVRGLAPRIVNGVTEIRIQHIHLTAIPSDFDGEWRVPHGSSWSRTALPHSDKAVLSPH